MNVGMIRPFLVATKRVFEKMLECPCRIGKPTISRGLEASDSVRGVVRVSGSCEGYLVLTLSSGVADVAATLLDVSDDAESAVRCTEAADLVARMITTILRRSAASDGMKFKAISCADSGLGESGSKTRAAWLVAPMVGRFGKFSFALSLRPVASTTATASLALATASV